MMENNEEYVRRLGYYERYSLSRTLSGFPPIVILLASVTNATAISGLESRIGELLILYPLLGCKILQGHTRQPAYGRANVTASDILSKEPKGDLERDAILRQELVAGAKMDIHSGPLWRVAVYSSGNDDSSYVALVVNHVLVDGRGTLNLFHALLSPELPQNGGIAPSMEATLDMSPGWARIIRTIFWSLVVPSLPKVFQPSFWYPQHLPWPGVLPQGPIGCPVGLVSMSFPSTFVPSLKLAGQNRGVPTIHPIIHAAALTALLAAQPSNTEALVVATATPISIRSDALNHPFTTGNYVAAVDTSRSFSPLENFWTIAREHSAELKSPATRKEAIASIGMMSFIPDPDRGPNAPTGWEEFLLASATSSTPYRTSLGMSNLGALPAIPGVGELLFTRDPSPIGDAINILIVGNAGLDGGLGITLTWAEGAIDGEVVRKVASVMESILHRIASQTIEETTKLNQLFGI